ncbi:hypothetical protein WISP_23722 [Willisornis vidua]|uniref:Uncharacterized protein n=1 Tax=Willisornis vidua TaxID=1566151 RepID=A0ABQ9DMG2_9PASS|nr:hypothetical protein WISP_23722 [Willisornis vidua]
MHQYRLGADLLESSSAEKDLGILVDRKLPMSSQQCVLVAKRASGILGSIRKNAASPGEVHLECCVQFCAPQDKRDMEILEHMHWRATDG